MSSKPTTATSSGTRTPAAAKARRTPIAIWSLAHTTASGSAPRYLASSFSPACSPLRTLKIPCVEPTSWHCGWPRSTCSRASRRWTASGESGGPSTWNRRRLPWSAMRWVMIAAEPEKLSAATTSAARSPGGPGDDDHGHPCGEALDVWEATNPSPMRIPSTLPDSASSRGKSGVRPVGLHEGDQQRPVVVADPRLDAAQHLVVVEQAHVLDVLRLYLALDAHHADDVLAAAGQALRGAVGHVAEFLDGLLHPGPGRLAHPVLAVHHPRDRRGGDAGQARHVVERYHVFPISSIAVFLDTRSTSSKSRVRINDM